MSKIKKNPKVILVGRTNVGKSTLFNRLTDNTKSIVFDTEGVTRDYISEEINWADKTFELIDTGGVSFKKQTDILLEQVRQKAFKLFEKAAFFLFVCDGKNGITEEDQQIAKILHKTKKPVLLLLNKADNKNLLEENYTDFYSLGFDDILPTSAIHGIGISELLEKIVVTIQDPIEEESQKPVYNVVILGKPNVGKSSLMNLLIKQERSIVHDQSGTTREAISENLYSSQDIIQITDTAGVRRKSKVEDKLESLMVKSSLSATRTSDIILLVVDSSAPKLCDQELKLLFYAYEQNKSIILVFNKTDLLNDYDRKSFEYNLKEYDYLIKKIPTVWISCLNKKNVGKILKNIQAVWTRLNQEFNSTQVNELVKEYWSAKPMFHKRIPLKLFKIRSIRARIPTFVLHVNHPQWFGPTQLGFIENLLRRNYDLKGCPVRFSIKKV